MSRPSRPFSSPSECPVCGCDVPPKSRACPGCGADETTGWNDDATRYDGLDLPDSAFEDDDTGPSSSQKSRMRNRAPSVTWIVAVLLLSAILASFVFQLL